MIKAPPPGLIFGDSYIQHTICLFHALIIARFESAVNDQYPFKYNTHILQAIARHVNLNELDDRTMF